MAKSVRTGAGFEVQGLKSFLKELKAVGAEYPAAVKQANFDAASQIVGIARGRAGAAGVVQSRRNAQSLKASRSGTAAIVSGGGPRYPTFWGAEFGAKRWAQFKPWRGNQWRGWEGAGGGGYFLHPTIRDRGPSILNEYVKTLRKLESQAFPD